MTRFLNSLTLIALVFVAPLQAAEHRPNVIVVMADDISTKEFAFYGSSSRYEIGRTPVLDRLAREGCFIKTAWSSTVCMPTRALVMSGRYAHLTKWWDNGQFGKGPEGGIYEVPDSSPLIIGQVAGQAGYRSIWVGKLTSPPVRATPNLVSTKPFSLPVNRKSAAKVPILIFGM